MSDKRYTFECNGNNCLIYEDGVWLKIEEVVELLNEQQFIINELRTYNLQHFLEWLVIKGDVTDEPLKNINNVIACVDEFKEYLTELDKFKAWLEVLEDE